MEFVPLMFAFFFAQLAGMVSPALACSIPRRDLSADILRDFPNPGVLHLQARAAV